MIVSVGFHVSCEFKKCEKFIKSLYNIFIDFSRFLKILIRCLVDEWYSDKLTLSSLNQTKMYVARWVLHQILWNKMVKTTENKGKNMESLKQVLDI